MPPARRSTRKLPKKPCPNCGSRRAVPIVYGMPAPDLVAKANTGCIILGGCLVSRDDAQFRCKDCSTDFR